MKITVPDFGSIVRLQPHMPTGAVLGGQAAQSLATLGASVANNKAQQRALFGFADAMEAESPEMAGMYRSIAENIPIVDASVLLGGGGGSRSSGGLGGGTGSLTGPMMENMMDLVKLKTREAMALKIEKLQTQNTINEIAARVAGDKEVLATESPQEREARIRDKTQRDSDAAAALRQQKELAGKDKDRTLEKQKSDNQVEIAKTYERSSNRSSDAQENVAKQQGENAKDLKVASPTAKEVQNHIYTSPEVSQARKQQYRDAVDKLNDEYDGDPALAPANENRVAKFRTKQDAERVRIEIEEEARKQMIEQREKAAKDAAAGKAPAAPAAARPEQRINTNQNIIDFLKLGSPRFETGPNPLLPPATP